MGSIFVTIVIVLVVLALVWVVCDQLLPAAPFNRLIKAVATVAGIIYILHAAGMF